MIYITGDIHADIDIRKLNTKNWPEQRSLTKEDYLIILGDFGLVWDSEESKFEKNWLDWLNDKPFTVLFIDGNHDNHERLATYQEYDWHGGKIHKIRPTVYHLMRGYVYEIEGYTFFTFGGARSHDITDGILEPNDVRIKSWREQNKMFRINHVEWWEGELPTEEECNRGLKVLEQYNNCVDYILTHDTSNIILKKLTNKMGIPQEESDILKEYFDKIEQLVTYKHWYNGHYHIDKDVTDKNTIVYDKIINLGEIANA